MDWALVNCSDWVDALVGGSLIGVAVALVWLFNGRIAGISGMVAGAIRSTPMSYERGSKIMFLLGLVVSPLFFGWFAGDNRLINVIQAISGESWLQWAIAGGLIGLGARLGSGCTSGHSVCGIARGKIRSITATLLFMLSGMVTVFVVRHVI